MNWTVPFLNSLTACLGSVCAERIPDSQGGASSALHSKLLYTRNCCPGTFDSGSIKTSAHSEIWWPRPSTSVMNIGKLFWIIPDTGDSGPKKTWDAMIQSAILASFSINAMVLCKNYAHVALNAELLFFSRGNWIWCWHVTWMRPSRSDIKTLTFECIGFDLSIGFKSLESWVPDL